MFGVWQKSIEVSPEDIAIINKVYQEECPLDKELKGLVNYYDDKILTDEYVAKLVPNSTLQFANLMASNKCVYSLLVCRKEIFLAVYCLDDNFAEKHGFRFVILSELLISLKCDNPYASEEELTRINLVIDTFYTEIAMAITEKVEQVENV